MVTSIDMHMSTQFCAIFEVSQWNFSCYYQNHLLQRWPTMAKQGQFGKIILELRWGYLYAFNVASYTSLMNKQALLTMPKWLSSKMVKINDRILTTEQKWGWSLVTSHRCPFMPKIELWLILWYCKQQWQVLSGGILYQDYWQFSPRKKFLKWHSD